MNRRPALWIAALASVASVALFQGLALGSENDASTSISTPDAAFETLLSERDLPNDQLEAVEATIDQAVESSPEDGRWVMARSLIATRRGDTVGAYKLAKAAVKLSPDDALLQYRFGNAAFDHIDDVSFINKGAVASKGKAAFERAIELDPTMIDAQVGLANYYIYAPAIAGGSIKKARQIVQTLRSLDGGAADAASVLMQIESKEENWDAFAVASKEAIAASRDVTQRQDIRVRLAFLQAFQAQQFEEAMRTVEAIREEGIPKNQIDSINYLDGYCRYCTGDVAGAIERFNETLRVNPDAKNTRLMLAQCYVDLGQPAEAAKHYEEYARRFKDDKQAKSAKKKAKKLRDALAKGD